MFGKKIFLLAAGYLAGGLIATLYGEKKGKKVREDLEDTKWDNKKTQKIMINNFIDTHKNFLDDLKERILTDENKEVFYKKVDEAKDLIKDYKKEWEKLVEELKERGSDYLETSKQKLEDLYESKKWDLEELKAKAPAKMEEVKNKLSEKFDEVKEKITK